MRQLFVHIVVASFVGTLLTSSVMAAKIKHLDSLYFDNAELALKNPEGVACDDDSIIVADTGNNRIVLYSMTNQSLLPKAVFPLDKISPIIVQISSKGDVFVLDGRSRSIVKIGQNGQVLGKIQPKGLPGSKTFIPRSFKLDKEDNIYVLDIFSERVLVLDATEKFVKQVPFPMGYKSFSDLAISPQGQLYILDGAGGVIYVANSGMDSFDVLSSDLKEHMNFPTSLALDSHGIIYLSDQYGSGLALVGRDGSFLGRKFGMGWENGQFYYPAQICINDQNVLAVADRNNSRVQVFSILEE